MKIVIEVPDGCYEELCNATFPVQDAYRLVKWICDGIPLSKIHERKFESIVVEYPPEYKGKPYFSIKYEENGEHFIGFGTYKSEVFSQYLIDYFITPTIIEADKENME